MTSKQMGFLDELKLWRDRMDSGKEASCCDWPVRRGAWPTGCDPAGR